MEDKHENGLNGSVEQFGADLFVGANLKIK